ncbi:MAG: ATP-dependent DNA helicase PcrA, partial [Gemmatimonadales bacterium]
HPGLLSRYQERFSFMLVDEYQDTNRAQFVLLEMLARQNRNLMVVGDDDQSIYGWRGADIRNILDFERTYEGAAVVRLETNYRSTPVILEAANTVIRHNLQRKEKTLRTDREGGDPILLVETADERDEARWLAEEIETIRREGEGTSYRDVAILYRTNAQSRALEDAFRRRGIPYQIVGGVRFYERREIQDVLSYLRLISNPQDSAAFQRIVNYPRRGIGKTSLGRLLQWGLDRGIPALEAARRSEEVPDLPAGARKSLARFTSLVERLSARAREVAAGPLVEELIEELDLLEHLRDEGPEGEDRAENVKELVAGAMDFDASASETWEGPPPEGLTDLDLFLQQVALITDLDRADPDADTVTFMTLHNAKGLEFPVVFIAGLEDGLFPMGRAFDDPEQLEEERRLFYVGITRAEDRLGFTWARERRRAGDFMYSKRSSFIDTVPDELLDPRRSPRLEREKKDIAPSARSRSGAGDRRGGRTRGGGNDAFGSAARKAARRAREEEVFEAGLDQDQPVLAKGARVSHPTFGGGTVMAASGRGDDLKVTVRFDSVGEKRLLARYAQLEREF